LQGSIAGERYAADITDRREGVRSKAMPQSDDASKSTVRVLLFCGGLLLLVVLGRFILADPSARQVALRAFLVLLAGAEGLAGFFYVFSAQQMAERAGRPYNAAYHGVMQDFGFYNLGTALLFVLCATDPLRNVVVLRAAIVFYALHAVTHILRYFGLYYGGETAIATRPRHLELRDGLQLAVGLAAMIFFYPYEVA
jgi:hypothetical protein